MHIEITLLPSTVPKKNEAVQIKGKQRKRNEDAKKCNGKYKFKIRS